MTVHDSPPHVVILGGGFGGLDAARALRRAPVSRSRSSIATTTTCFSRCCTRSRPPRCRPGDIASPIRWILRRQKNVQVLLAEARASIDARGIVSVVHRSAGDARTYDYLIVATGAAHAYFGHPEWAARAPGLKTLDDALEIRRQVLLAFEAAERETDPDSATRPADVRDRRRRTDRRRTGRRACRDRAAVAAQDFRSIHPESARIVLIEGSPHVLGTFPDAAARSGAAIARAARRRGADRMRS